MEVANFEFSHYEETTKSGPYFFRWVWYNHPKISIRVATFYKGYYKGDMTGMDRDGTESMEHKRKNNLNPQPNKSTSPPSTSQKHTKTNPASSRTSRINRFRWSLQFPASATISKSPSSFGIAKCMKKARTNSWKELNTQKKPTAWLLDCWTTQQKKHPNPKVTEDHRPISMGF